MTGALTLFFAGGKAYAHGFGERIDLPIPFTLYALGAAVTIAVSFILIGILSGDRNPRNAPQVDLLQFRIGRFLFANRSIRTVLQLISLLVAIVITIAGFVGSPIPSYNIAPTFVWILFAVGMVYVSAFFGNIWPILHPAAIVYDALTFFIPKRRKKETWSDTVSAWPAVVLYFLFRWVENVHPTPSDPQTVALLVGMYLLLSFVGMITLGKQNWLRYCDPFNVFFRFLSFFAIFNAEEKEGSARIFLRFPGTGLFSIQKIPLSGIVFEMLMLSTIAFDGMKETPSWKLVRTAPWHHFSVPVIDTIGMLVFLMLFLCTYFCIAWLISLCIRHKFSVIHIASAFAFSMLPIAVAYEVAHFISLFLLDGQRAVYLLSDPLGFGWNVLGTARYEIRYGIINFKVLWNFQVLLIVLGHIVGVYVAHIRALHILENRRIAIRSQYPMLLLMVCYTMFSLWVIAQPIIGS